MIEVFDNLIPSKMQDYFETLVFGSDHLSGQLPFRVNTEYLDELRHRIPTRYAFIHQLKDQQSSSDYFYNFAIIVKLAVEQIGLKIVDIPIARLHITYPDDTDELHYTLHNDAPYPHIVVLYFINDSEGDLYVYSKDGKELIKTVSPKKGRLVVMDGTLQHGPGIARSSLRGVANFVVEVIT